MSLPRLHLITDADVVLRPGFGAVAAAVLRCCGRYCALHVRAHGVNGAQLYELADELAAAALRTGAWLIVNDRVDIALATRANGVQLGNRSVDVADARALLGAGAHIGVSAHGVADVVQADIEGADFALLGNIHETRSHPGRRALGIGELARAAAAAAVPVIAIGGITPEHAAEVSRAGAYGLAVVGGVWRATDPVDAAAEYVAAVHAAWSDEHDGDNQR